MKKIRTWFYRKFLPGAAHDMLLEELESLRKEVVDLTRENERLTAYAEGLKSGMRLQRRITIINHSAEDKNKK